MITTWTSLNRIFVQDFIELIFLRNIAGLLYLKKGTLIFEKMLPQILLNARQFYSLFEILCKSR